MQFPCTRGLASNALLDVLSDPINAQDDAISNSVEIASLGVIVDKLLDAEINILTDEDLQLTLFCLYELHYLGFDGVDERFEWSPGLLAIRHKIEHAFEVALRAICQLPTVNPVDSDGVADVLFALAAQDSGPSLAKYVAKQANLEQLHEFVIHKSIYQLKEADPHTWAIPRLSGRAKAALVEIQADEYGGGDPQRMHSALFARTMRGLGLEDTYGAYLDVVPALTLAATNMMSMFGLNRRLRGAIVGHLAAYEMTSSQPNRLYGNGFRRHGFGEDVTGYFDEHVEADAVHEQIAGRDMAGGLFESEPDLLQDIYFGAAAALALDALAAQQTLAAWEAGESSLRLVDNTEL